MKNNILHTLSDGYEITANKYGIYYIIGKIDVNDNTICSESSFSSKDLFALIDEYEYKLKVTNNYPSLILKYVYKDSQYEPIILSLDNVFSYTKEFLYNEIIRQKLITAEEL